MATLKGGRSDWGSPVQDGNVTTVGTNGGASAYGAFDMSGNLYEWNDLTGATSRERGVQGGYWGNTTASALSSSGGYPDGPSGEGFDYGFRLSSVAVPEPSTCASLLAGLACGGYVVVRRRKQG